MYIPRDRSMQPHAKNLRKHMTSQERKLWYLFLRKYPAKICRQRVILSFIADFYCHAAKLVIEVDGIQHTTEQGVSYDKERTEIMAQYGLAVVRFSNREIDENFPAVCEKIHQTIRNRTDRQNI